MKTESKTIQVRNITEELYNKQELENIKKELYKKFEKDKKKYLSTYYYLTGDKYEHLEIYNKKK